MQNYVVKGTFKAGHSWENFTKTIESQNEKNAREKTYSIFGSKHGLNRSLIKIDSVVEA
ncbi:50S ribosomal protein L18Ae [Methanococcoides methylutens]|uniref:Large ribosomal subunit protein eL20 n=1 Tax=Methanococcoides methylutens MM1 TaxID=1434104 RepID=A0A0E3SRE2_METMT|nr:50S ribosomal protein L18Ae [Methanococcoides methylutens]AKB84752.1 LSU ribosomal protein L18Ae [Methanococcoides methylutens MM1]